MEPQLDRPPDLRSLLHSLWRRKWLFLGILVSIPAAVYVISSLVTKTYQASTLIRLEAVRTDIASLSTPTIPNVDTEALLLNTEKVAEQAADEIGGGASPTEISSAVRTEPLTTGSGQATDLLYVTAQASDPADAASFANAYASAIDEVRTGKALREIDASIASLEAESRDASNETAEAEFERQLQLLRGARTSAQDSTQVIQAASAPSSPISPNPRRNTALATLVALLIALGAAALAERLDRRMRDSSELEPLLGAPLLSVIPRGAFPGEKPAHGPVKEAFRTLASSLVYFNVERPVSTVIVASPTKGDGKTTVAVHLAVALARDGKRTILVDCDLRHPQVAVRLGIEPGAGVVDVLTEQAYLADALVEVDVGEGRLQVLAAGPPPPNPARLLGSPRMDALLAKLSKRAEVVVIDSPPILNVSDTVPLLERVSGIVVVAKVGATSKDALQRVRQVIETARGNILGAVATGSAGAGLYGYGAEYYGDESVETEAPLPEPRAEDEEPAPGEEPSEVDAGVADVDEDPAEVSRGDTEEWVLPPPESSRPNGSYGQEPPQPQRPAPPSPPAHDVVAQPPPSGQLPPGESERGEQPRWMPIIEEPTQAWEAVEDWRPPEDWRPAPRQDRGTANEPEGRNTDDD